MSLASLCPYSSEMRPWHSLSRDGVRFPVESRLTLWFALSNWKQPTWHPWHPVPSELKSCSFRFNSWDPEPIVCEEAQCPEAHGNMSGSCRTSSPNCQASEWGCFGPRWAISDDYSHTNKWLKTFLRAFSGSPVVKTLLPLSVPGEGTKIPNALHCSQKIKKENKKQIYTPRFRGENYNRRILQLTNSQHGRQ